MMFQFPRPVPDAPLPAPEKLAWLRLARTDNIGPVTFHRLIDRYGSAVRALEALPQLAARGGRKAPLTAAPLAVIEKEIEAMAKAGARIIAACEPDYPLALAALEDAPPVLTVRGRADLLNRACIGIVGSRNASLNGRRFAEMLARDLGQAGQTVVSGLARGIDTAAHQGSLATGTVAVVAGGADIVYPPENEALYRSICEQGVVVAENAWGMQPFAQSFPRRNRIVSGISSGIVVVEASLRSGSLITARMAGEQGRDVYAVPGSPMDPRAEGPNNLIRDGAVLIRNAADILENTHSFRGTPHLNDPAFSPFHHEDTEGRDPPANLHDEIMAVLSPVAVPVDELVRSCHLSSADVQSALLELELAGRVQRLPGNRVCRIGE